MNYSVYIIQNTTNKKVYVGFAKDAQNRWKKHKEKSHNIKSDCYYQPFYSAIRKDGWDNFTKQIIEEFDNKNEALNAEMFWIEFFRSNRMKYGNECGYNMTNGGEAPMLDKKMSKETRSKISFALMGKSKKPFTDEHRKNLTNKQRGRIGVLAAHHGYKHTNETKIAIGKANRGKTWKLVNGKRVWMEIKNVQ